MRDRLACSIRQIAPQIIPNHILTQSQPGSGEETSWLIRGLVEGSTAAIEHI